MAYTTIGSESVISVSGAKEVFWKKKGKLSRKRKSLDEIFHIEEKKKEEIYSPVNIRPILFAAQAASTQPTSACDTRNLYHDAQFPIMMPEESQNV